MDSPWAPESASYALTSSYAENAGALPGGLISSSTQFSDITDPFTGSYTGSFVGDGSGLLGLVSASHALQADSAKAADTSTSASHAVNADLAFEATSSLTATSASHALQADNAKAADSSTSASYALTASYAENAGDVLPPGIVSSST